MGHFKSGIITKYGVVLTPRGIESHERLLQEMKIRDANLRYGMEGYKSFPRYSTSEGFVRAELIPPDNWAVDAAQWEYRVSYDSLPAWYADNCRTYEQLFRSAVKKYMTRNYIKICGYAWQPILYQKTGMTYLFAGNFGKMSFGLGNNYAESDVRKFLLSSQLYQNLQDTFGDNLLPLSIDLRSSCRCNAYGMLEKDRIGILTEEEYTGLLYNAGIEIESRNVFWLATPKSAPSSGSAGVVMNGNGSCHAQEANSCCSLTVMPCIKIRNFDRGKSLADFLKAEELRGIPVGRYLLVEEKLSADIDANE